MCLWNENKWNGIVFRRPSFVVCPLSITILMSNCTHLIFSSGNPRVSNTKPHSNSLKVIPFCVPPQAVYSQSANTVGTPSFISWTKTVLLRSVPFVPVDRLNASLMRRNSLSVTVNRKQRRRKKEIKKEKKKREYNQFDFIRTPINGIKAYLFVAHAQRMV